MLVAMLLMPALVRSVPAVAVPMPFNVSHYPISSEADRRQAAVELVPTPATAVSGPPHAVITSASSNGALRPPTTSAGTPRFNWALTILGLYELRRLRDADSFARGMVGRHSNRRVSRPTRFV